MKLFKKDFTIKRNTQELENISPELFVCLKLFSENGKYDSWEMALGEHENMTFSEVRTEDAYSLCTYDSRRSAVRGFRMNAATEHADGKFSEDNLEDRIAAVALALRHLEKSENTTVESWINKFKMFEASHGETLDENEIFELVDICNNIESSVIGDTLKASSELSCFQKPVKEINLSKIDTGLLGPSKIIMGSFKGFKPLNRTRKVVKFSEIKDKFKINPSRVFTEEEAALMYRVPKWYSPSENVLSIAEKIKASWKDDSNLHKTNILMEGPAGTGKTVDSKVLSALLGIPYTKITCFADMDSSDVTGAILPVSEEEQPVYEPTEDEMFFEPASCYEKVTGTKLTEEEAKDITVEDVKAALEQAYKKYYASQDGQNSPRYVYYASEIVKAFEQGWLVEIQEPTCVADAAVLLVLNSALEKDGVINLAQRTVRRHPECIIVMTTNRDYEGCRPLNQALRDRFNITKKVKLPSIDEQVERLSSATECENKEFLRNFVESVQALNGYLKDNGINASVSLRGMIDFVADSMRGFDLKESLMEDLVYKITTDDEEVAEIENFLELSTNIYSLSLEG